MNLKIFRIFLVVSCLSTALIVFSLLSGFSVTESFLLGLSPWPFLLLFLFPNILLFLLLFIRPSLDGLAEILAFPLPFDPERFITAAQLFGLLTVILGTLFCVGRVKQILKTPLLIPFLLLLFWGTSTLFYSIDTSKTLYEILRLFSLFFVFLLAYSVITSQKRFSWLLFVTLSSAIIPILVALYQFVFHIGYVDDAFSVPRIYGTFAHPNIFALYLVVVLGSTLLLFSSSSEKRTKNISLFALFSIFTILVMTYARAAWATFFFFLGLLATIKYPKILPALIFIPLALFLISPTIQDRVAEGVNLTPSSSLMWRITIWNDTIHQTVSDNKILLGYGLNTFETVAENLRGVRFLVNAPHSEFVRSFVEGGIVGLCIFLFFSLAPIILLWKLWRKNKNTVSGDIFLILGSLFISLLLLSFTDHVLRSTMVQWILFALLGGALKVYGDAHKK